MSKPHTDRIVPAAGQQMDRSNDPETTAEMDAAAPEAALASRRQRLTGSAVGASMLADWPRRCLAFTKVMPTDYKRVLDAARMAEAEGRDVDSAIMEAARG